MVHMLDGAHVRWCTYINTLDEGHRTFCFTMSISCQKCNKSFASNYSYNRHVDKFHRTVERMEDNDESPASSQDDLDKPTIFGCTARELIDQTLNEEQRSAHFVTDEDDTAEEMEDGEDDDEDEQDEEDEEDEQQEAGEHPCKSEKMSECDNDSINITPIWAFWLTATARRQKMKKWSDIEENYSDFIKEFSKEVYIRCRMYQELTNNDSVYEQLLKEERRLLRHGYGIPGEAWQTAWRNRKCLITCLMEHLKEKLQ